MSCTKILKFKNLLVSKRDFFEFVDAVYIITVKEEKITNRQKNCIRNINMLGCQNKTYWCVTKGYKDNACNHSRPYENLCYNHFHITTEDAIKNKYKNIVIFEDDFTIESNIWKDYNERKKSIEMLINENKKNAMVIFLGYMPWFSVFVNDRVSKGIFANAHAWMMNINAIREVNKMQITKSCIPDNINGIYKKFLKIKFYAIKPNNLFFQLSDKNSEMGKSKVIGRISFLIQKLITKRMYYQYDPIFAKYYNPIIEGISTSLKLFIYLYMINYISAKI